MNASPPAQAMLVATAGAISAASISVTIGSTQPLDVTAQSLGICVIFTSRVLGADVDHPRIDALDDDERTAVAGQRAPLRPCRLAVVTDGDAAQLEVAVDALAVVDDEAAEHAHPLEHERVGHDRRGDLQRLARQGDVGRCRRGRRCRWSRWSARSWGPPSK